MQKIQNMHTHHNIAISPDRRQRMDGVKERVVRYYVIV